ARERTGVLERERRAGHEVEVVRVSPETVDNILAAAGDPDFGAIDHDPHEIHVADVAGKAHAGGLEVAAENGVDDMLHGRTNEVVKLRGFGHKLLLHFLVRGLPTARVKDTGCSIPHMRTVFV